MIFSRLHPREVDRDVLNVKLSKAVDVLIKSHPVSLTWVQMFKFQERNSFYAHFDRFCPLGWNLTVRFVIAGSELRSSWFCIFKHENWLISHWDLLLSIWAKFFLQKSLWIRTPWHNFHLRFFSTLICPVASRFVSDLTDVCPLIICWDVWENVDFFILGKFSQNELSHQWDPKRL